jgi:hypothetical protein
MPVGNRTPHLGHATSKRARAHDPSAAVLGLLLEILVIILIVALKEAVPTQSGIHVKT